MHCDLERLPVPFVLSTMHIPHDPLHFVHTRPCVLPQVVVANFVPVVSRDFTLNTTSSDCFEPVVERHILLGFTLEDRRVFPLFKDRFEIKRFDLESVEEL